MGGTGARAYDHAPVRPLSLWPLLAATLVTAPLQAEQVTGLVVAVADGDTITVLDFKKTQHKIRLAGIDAREKAQPFGNRSRQNLAGLTFKQDVTLDCFKVDRYRRQICRVYLGGKDVALAQIEAGLAWHYKRCEGDQTSAERATYAQTEEKARAARVVLWQDKSSVPPREWRRGAKP